VGIQVLELVCDYRGYGVNADKALVQTVEKEMEDSVAVDPRGHLGRVEYRSNKPAFIRVSSQIKETR
jgi:hypothetical protein